MSFTAQAADLATATLFIESRQSSTFDLSEFGDYNAHKSGERSKKEIPLSPPERKYNFPWNKLIFNRDINNAVREKSPRLKIKYKMKTDTSFFFQEMVFNEFGN